MRLSGVINPSQMTAPRRGSLQGLPNGIAGATTTLRIMRDLVRAAIRDPAQGIREAALNLIQSTAYVQQIRDIQTWVQDNVRYVRDPIDDSGGVELVQTPQVTLQLLAGDCDDQATLVAALLSVIGHPCRFIAMWFSDPNDGHVLCQTLIGRTWVAVETIKPEALGYMPPGITSHYILKV